MLEVAGGIALFVGIAFLAVILFTNFKAFLSLACAAGVLVILLLMSGFHL